MSNVPEMPEYDEQDLLESEEYLQDMYDIGGIIHMVYEFSWNETEMINLGPQWNHYLDKYAWFGHVVNMMRACDIVRSREDE